MGEESSRSRLRPRSPREKETPEPGAEPALNEPTKIVSRTTPHPNLERVDPSRGLLKGIPLYDSPDFDWVIVPRTPLTPSTSEKEERNGTHLDPYRTVELNSVDRSLTRTPDSSPTKSLSS